MGRKTLSVIQIVVLVALAALAIVCLFTYARVARLPLPFVHAPATANARPRPLAELALTKSEIEGTLQTGGPLTLKSAQNTCDISTARECIESSYTASAGDLFTLMLARFATADDAINFGIGLKFQQEQEQHAAPLDLPITAENFRWLDAVPRGATSLYYGGGNERSIAIFMTWGPTASSITADDAVQIFSQLLEAQIEKIRLGFSG